MKFPRAAAIDAAGNLYVADQQNHRLLFFPAGTPRDIVLKVRSEIARGLAKADTQEKLLGLGIVPGGGTPEELAAFVQGEADRWQPLIRKAGIKAD